MRSFITLSWSFGNTKSQASSAYKDTLSTDEVLHYTFLVLWQHKLTLICTQRYTVNRWGAPPHTPGPQATQTDRLHLHTKTHSQQMRCSIKLSWSSGNTSSNSSAAHTDTMSTDRDVHYTLMNLQQHKLAWLVCTQSIQCQQIRCSSPDCPGPLATQTCMTCQHTVYTMSTD